MQEPEEAVCTNCGAPVVTNFCGECGQKSITGGLDWKHLSETFISFVFNFDRPFIKTLRGVLWNPGLASRKYIQGQHQTYYHPIRFFVFILAIYVLIRVFVEYDPLAIQVELAEGEVSENIQTSFDTRVADKLSQSINYILFVLVSILAIVGRFFFQKSRFNIVEFHVLSFYAVSAYLIFAGCITPLTVYVSPYFQYVIAGILFVYLPLALYSFVQPKQKLLGLFKAILVVVIAYVIYIPTVYYSIYGILWVSDFL